VADTLFDVTPDPAAPKLSQDQRRTQRQAEALRYGQHPLTAALRAHLPLHPNAAPINDRDAPGRRCGNCWYRRQYRRRNGCYPKCWFSTGSAGQFPQEYDRITHGPGTDARAWWPACRDHTYGEPSLSPDAARWVPEAEVCRSREDSTAAGTPTKGGMSDGQR
jgi:hypothetical protein